MRQILGWFLGLFVLAVVYGAINLVLYVGQSIMDSDEKEQMKLLDSKIIDFESNLKKTEIELEGLQNKITQLEEKMKTWKSFNVNLYNSNVDTYNSMITDYQTKFRGYKIDYEKYKQSIEEYNILAEEVGSTYYILPIPIK